MLFQCILNSKLGIVELLETIEMTVVRKETG